jgi:hypothetical protein
MNPLTYTEIFTYFVLYTFYYMLFRCKWILSLIPKYLFLLFCIHSILWRLWYKWILSLIPKYPLLLFCGAGNLNRYGYKWILSLIPKYLHILFCIHSIICYFDVSESSHLYRNIYFFCSVPYTFYSMAFWYKWILSLIPSYLNSYGISFLLFSFSSYLARLYW